MTFAMKICASNTLWIPGALCVSVFVKSDSVSVCNSPHLALCSGARAQAHTSVAHVAEAVLDLKREAAWLQAEGNIEEARAKLRRAKQLEDNPASTADAGEADKDACLMAQIMIQPENLCAPLGGRLQRSPKIKKPQIGVYEPTEHSIFIAS